jgi:hypothetical protein
VWTWKGHSFSYCFFLPPPFLSFFFFSPFSSSSF